MNVNHINPLLKSTMSVLSTMAMVEAKPGKPSIKKGLTPLGDITGMIDLSENGHTRGSLAISFPSLVIFDIAKNMLGETTHTIDSSIVDMVGEITNMITGSAKRIYSEQGMNFELTLPNTTVGNEIPLKHSVEGQTVVLPFSTSAGSFYIELCFSTH